VEVPSVSIDVSSSGRVWAVVLAGGDGVRLRDLVRRVHGDDRPKQFAALAGSRSLLRQTLDRIEAVIPPERTVIVTRHGQECHLSGALAGARVHGVLSQPENRGTAAAILFAADWIRARDPEAVVAVFPSDHFVLEEARFARHVADVVAVLDAHPDWLILLGAEAGEPDPEYGWIELGATLAWTGNGEPISRVQRFWEKPSGPAAIALHEKGWLWNTFIFVARAAVLCQLGFRYLPDMAERFARMAPFRGTELEAWALQQAYAHMRKASFSASILEMCPPCLTVSALPPVQWADWGTPGRVLESLRKAGVLPPWLAASDLRPVPGSAAAPAAPGGSLPD
jgi:mannose-1-phosphate guanylyltransferase